jgi:hypothetical protein
MKKAESDAQGINGQECAKARLQEHISQLSELNRAYLLGTELSLLFAQNSQSCSGSREEEIQSSVEQ